MIVQRLKDGRYRNKATGRIADSVVKLQDITHRQDLKRKGYTPAEIKKIEKDNIARGADRNWLDQPMKSAPDIVGYLSQGRRK